MDESILMVDSVHSSDDMIESISSEMWNGDDNAMITELDETIQQPHPTLTSHAKELKRDRSKHKVNTSFEMETKIENTSSSLDASMEKVSLPPDHQPTMHSSGSFRRRKKKTQGRNVSRIRPSKVRKL